MPAYSLPSWTSPAGQLYHALLGIYTKELYFSPYPNDWPKRVDDVVKRFQAIAGLFDVTMTREYHMPPELVHNVGAHWDFGRGNEQGPAFSADYWPKDGFWVVKAGTHVLCFQVECYPAGGHSISFSNMGDHWRFNGYGAMPISDFFNILFYASGWGSDEKAYEVVKRWDGHLQEEVDWDDIPDHGLLDLNNGLMNLVFA